VRRVGYLQGKRKKLEDSLSSSVNVIVLSPSLIMTVELQDAGRKIWQTEIVFQINHEPNATIFQFIILTFIYSSTCFGRFPPIIRSSMTAVAASGLPSYRGDSCAVYVVGRATTAVVELLMMGGKTPETC